METIIELIIKAFLDLIKDLVFIIIVNKLETYIYRLFAVPAI